MKHSKLPTIQYWPKSFNICSHLHIFHSRWQWMHLFKKNILVKILIVFMNIEEINLNVYSLKSFHAWIQIKSIVLKIKSKSIGIYISANSRNGDCLLFTWKLSKTESKTFLGVMSTKAKKCHVMKKFKDNYLKKYRNVIVKS